MDKNSLEKIDKDALKKMGYEMVDFVIKLAGESERSAVVLGAARIDYSLERLIKKVMHHNSGGDDNLFSPDRPLGSFSSKIALACRLGLISMDVEHALQMIRKIRNDFAHSIEGIRLKESPHRERISELKNDASKSILWATLNPIMSKGVTNEYLRDFCSSIATLLTVIEVSEYVAERFSVGFPAVLENK